MSEITFGPIPASVAVGMLKARRAVQAVAKAAKNEHHGYKYASSEAMMSEGLRALNEGGLVFMRMSHATAQIERPRSIALEGGGIETVREVVTRLRCTFALVAEDGGTAWITTDNAIVPGKGKPEDKAEFGIQTEAYAYALRDILGIPRGDDSLTPSARNDTDDPGPQPPAARRAPPAARPLAPLANDAPPPPEARGPAAWPPRGAVSGERGDEEVRLSGIVAAAETPAAAEAAWGACKASLDAGAISKDVARRLHDAYKARRDVLATQGAAQ